MTDSFEGGGRKQTASGWNRKLRSPAPDPNKRAREEDCLFLRNRVRRAAHKELFRGCRTHFDMVIGFLSLTKGRTSGIYGLEGGIQ